MFHIIDELVSSMTGLAQDVYNPKHVEIQCNIISDEVRISVTRYYKIFTMDIGSKSWASEMQNILSAYHKHDINKFSLLARL